MKSDHGPSVATPVVWTGLLAILVACGLSAGAAAQTIFPTEIYEGETLEFTIKLSSQQGMDWNSGGLNSTVQGHNTSVATQQSSSSGSGDWFLSNSDGTYRDSIINATELSAVQVSDGYTLTFHIHANTDADTAEDDENLQLNLTADSAGLPSINITLKDGPRPAMVTDGVTLSKSALTLTELGSSSSVEKTYTVMLNTDPGENVTITVTSYDTSAVKVDTNSGTAGDQSTLTFTHGNTGNWNVAQTVTLRAVNDGDTAAENVTISHAAVVTGTNNPYHGIEINDVTAITIDAGHGVTVSKTNVSMPESFGKDTYTVVLKSEPGSYTSVVITPTSSDPSRAEVNPKLGGDTLIFTNGDWNKPKTVTVTGTSAGMATISHVVTPTTAYPASTLIAPVTVTVTAVATPAVIVQLPAVTPATEGVGADFSVRVNKVQPTDLTINLFVSEAKTLGDYAGHHDFVDSANEGETTVTIASGQTTVPYTVPTVDDNTDEPFVHVRLFVDPGDGYLAASPNQVGRAIVDNDPTSVTLAGGGTVAEDGNASAEVTITLSRKLALTESVVVPLTISGTGVDAADYAIALKSGDGLNTAVTLKTTAPHSAAMPAVKFGANRNTAQTAILTVTAKPDRVDEGASETFTIGFGSGTRAVTSNLETMTGTNTTATTPTGTAIVTITDDDAPADSTAPQVASIERQSTTSEHTNADSLTWRVTFNEAVRNVDMADFTVVGPNSSTTLTVAPVTDSETTSYDVTVTGGNLATLDSTVTLSFASDHNIEDMAGNALAATPSPPDTNNNSFEVDNTAPTVTITGLTSTITGASTITITFKEAVTGFAEGDITAGNGTVSEFTNTVAGTTWTALITPTGTGTVTVTVDVAANVATDLAGNANTAATQASASYTAPGVTFSTSTLALTELGSSSTVEKTYTVLLDTDPGANVVVTVASNDTSAVKVDTDSDTADDQDTLTFTTSNYNQAQTVTVRALNDGDADGESVTISHTVAVSSDTNNPYHQFVIDNVTVNITDAGHGVVLSKNALTVAENGGSGSYTVVLKSQPTTGVGIVLTPLTNTEAVHLSSTPTFSSSNWQTPQTITVTGVIDNIDNTGDARSVSIHHSTSTTDANYNGRTIDNVVVTVEDDDAAPTTLTLSVDADTGTNNIQSSLAEDDGGKTVRVTATLDGSTTFGTNKTVSLEVGKSSDSATKGVDYATVGTQSITINAGETSGYKDFVLTPTPDTLHEGDETISLTGTLAGVTMAPIAITLTDADAALTNITLSVDADTGTDNIQNSLAEDGGAKTVRVTATLVGSTTFGTNKTVSLAVGKSSDSATDGVDYTTVTTRNITINAETTSGLVDFTLTPTNDEIAEDDESISLTGTLTGVTIPSISITLTDNDTAGLVFTPDPVSVNEGGSSSYTVVLTSEPTANVTVSISGQGGSTDLTVDTDSGTPSNQNTLTFTASNWNQAQTVTIAAAEDVDGVNDTITLVHAPLGGGYGSTQNKNLGVTIIDDEADTTAPSVTSITYQTPSSSPTNADSLTWRITFSEPVVNVTAADFAITGTPATTATITGVTVDSNNVYDVTASGGNLASYEGSVQLSFVSTHDIDDANGNDLVASPTPTDTNQDTFVLDNTAPTVTITSLPSTIAGTTPITITFTEAVTGFELGDITVGNGTVSSLATSDSGITWTATLTPGVNGSTVTVDIAANRVTDDAGNGNTAATQVSADYTTTLGAPSGFSATTGDTEVSLAWGAPTGNSGTAALTKYQYRYQAGTTVSTGTWTDVPDGSDVGLDTDDETSFTVTGLTNGTQYAFELRAENDAGGGTAATATATPSAPNNAPTVANDIPDQTATVGTAFSYTFPANTFSDADGDSLTYTATKSDDTALPTWVTFNAGTRTFSGTPQVVDVGTLLVKVTADDNNGGTVSDTFDIEVSAATNNTPTLDNPIPSQTATVGTAFNYTFPANTFSDADGDSLTYSAAKSDGITLPTWLSFNSPRTFSGTPQAGDVGTLSVKVTTNDGKSGTISDTFNIVVSANNDTAGLVFTPDPVSVNEGGSSSYTVVLTSEPTANVTVSISGQGGSTDLTVDTDSGTPSNQNTLTFTASNWNQAQTVTIAAAEDVDGVNDTITLVHAPLGGGYGSTQNKNLGVTIIDDEADTTAPSVTSITYQTPSSSPTNADSLTWRITFSEPVVNVTAADFAITGTPATTATITGVTVDSNNVYDVTASGGNLASYEGSVQLSFVSTHDIDDANGNDLVASPTPTDTNQDTFVLDNTAPTVTITSLPSTIAGTTPITITFTEAVTGFELGDITVGNGTVSSLATSDSGITWTATLTPGVNGSTVTVDIAANRVTDDAGNGNTAATQVSADYTTTLGAPSGFSATTGDTEVSLAWGAPTGNSGTAALTKYQYRYQAGTTVSTGTWTDVPDGSDVGLDTDDETSFTVTGLTNGTQYAFELRAENDAGGGTAATATATPSAPNNAPTVANDIPDQTATVGTAFSYTFPANTFSDADGDSLTYTATKSDDTALPTWVTFNAGTRTFSGTPQVVDVGTLLVKVTADDNNGGTVSDTFDIEVSAATNNTPTLDNPIPSQTATVGTAFNYTFPANTFSDADGDSLTYSAAKSDGITLPTWLSFNSPRTFSGTPQAGDVGTLSVKVTTNDGKSGTISDTFNIVVSANNDTAGLVFTPDPVSVNEGGSSSYTVVLTSEPTANVTVSISGQGGSTDLTVDTDSGTPSNQNTLTFTASNWNQAQTVTIAAAEDVDGVNDTITLVHAPLGGGYGSTQNKNLGVTIIDDEADTTAPSVTSITYQTPSSSPTNADSLTWRITFSEPVVNVTAADFAITGTPATTATITGVTVDSNNVYDVTASGGNLASYEGSVQLSFVSTHDIDDANGNDLVASPTPTDTNQDTFVLDNTAPTVTITSLPSTIAGTTPITITFTEAVTGFELGDITVGNGTVSSLATSDSGITWTATLTPGVNGSTVTVDIAANRVTDDAGNGNTAATQVSADYTTTLGAPSGFSATTGDTEVSLAWGAPTGNSGTAALTKYQYRYQAGTTVSTGTWTDVPDGSDVGLDTDDETSFTVTGLTNGTQYAFELRAENDAGGGTAATATATPSAPNNAPTVANDIPDQTATVGTAFSYTFPANTFSDADGDSLTYTATKSDDTALPTWVTFNAGTRTFSGTPQVVDVGTLLVKVTADDNNGGTVSDTFNIVVSPAASEEEEANADPRPPAWLSRFGRTVAEQALDGVSNRLDIQRSSGIEGTLAGHALAFGVDSTGTNGIVGSQQGIAGSPIEQDALGFSKPASQVSHMSPSGHDVGTAEPQAMSLSEALLGSSFTATSEEDAKGGTIAVWGRMAKGSFEGKQESISLSGEVTTGMLGLDYAHNNWLAGLTLLQSTGEGSYTDSATPSTICSDRKKDEECTGRVESSLTAAVPYAALQVAERLKLWGALGFGSGDMTLKPSEGEERKTDIDWKMVATGLRGELLTPIEGGGFTLALVSDALWSRTSSNKVEGLAASRSRVTRLRAGLEGSWQVALENGNLLTPKLVASIRRDGGDAETGSGVEMGAGIAWRNPVAGIAVSLEGRKLVTHTNKNLKDRSIAVSFLYDPNPASARGPSVSMRQEIGEPTGGEDVLFAPGPLEEVGGEATTRQEVEAAWGFPALGGDYTGSPYVAQGSSDTSRDTTIGWRLTPEHKEDNAPDLSLGVMTRNRQKRGEADDQSVGLDLIANW